MLASLPHNNSALPLLPPTVLQGISPDDTVPGVVNLFEMTPTGQITRGVAAITTGDKEYPKVSTLHCSWHSPLCFFATGVGAEFTQDAVRSYFCLSQLQCARTCLLSPPSTPPLTTLDASAPRACRSTA